MKLQLALAQAEFSDLMAVRALIVEGLTERLGTYDPTFNADLQDFASAYAGAVVVVAKLEGHIVGCGALTEEHEKAGRIVRMSVAKNHRRSGIGSRLLVALLQASNRAGHERVVLETTATWESAVAFYESHGFRRAGLENGDQHFVRIASAA